VDADPDLTVVRASQAAGILSFDPDRLNPLFGEARLIDVQSRVGIPQDLDHVSLEFLEEFVVRPRGLGDELLQGTHHTAVDGFSDVLDAAAIPAEQEPLNKAVGVVLRLVPAETRGVAFEKHSEFRSELTECFHVHVRSPGEPPGGYPELPLYQILLWRRRS